MITPFAMQMYMQEDVRRAQRYAAELEDEVRKLRKLIDTMCPLRAVDGAALKATFAALMEAHGGDETAAAAAARKHVDMAVAKTNVQGFGTTEKFVKQRLLEGVLK